MSSKWLQIWDDKYILEVNDNEIVTLKYYESLGAWKLESNFLEMESEYITNEDMKNCSIHEKAISIISNHCDSKIKFWTQQKELLKNIKVERG
ncbi:MAG: hypothetical protein K0R54_543 [Clostridiaceae bacterium]|jgi:hypothetical protein|nr:hypothetical protein [Clostridiaceae bacterium]